MGEKEIIVMQKRGGGFDRAITEVGICGSSYGMAVIWGIRYEDVHMHGCAVNFRKVGCSSA